MGRRSASWPFVSPQSSREGRAEVRANRVSPRGSPIRGGTRIPSRAAPLLSPSSVAGAVRERGLRGFASPHRASLGLSPAGTERARYPPSGGVASCGGAASTAAGATSLRSMDRPSLLRGVASAMLGAGRPTRCGGNRFDESRATTRARITLSARAPRMSTKSVTHTRYLCSSRRTRACRTRGCRANARCAGAERTPLPSLFRAYPSGTPSALRSPGFAARTGCVRAHLSHTSACALGAAAAATPTGNRPPTSRGGRRIGAAAPQPRWASGATGRCSTPV